MVQDIEIGNQFYDRYFGGDAGMFGVQEAAQKVQGLIGIFSVGHGLPADTVRKPVATVNLKYHVQLNNHVKSEHLTVYSSPQDCGTYTHGPEIANDAYQRDLQGGKATEQKMMKLSWTAEQGFEQLV